MLHGEITAALQDMEKSHHIGLHVGRRIVNAVTDTRLGSQIHHNIRPVFLKYPEHIRIVRKVSSDKAIIIIVIQL